MSERLREGFLRRLDDVTTRLDRLARDGGDGLTGADPQTGERWDRGQVWAHLGEFIPFWLSQAERLIAADLDHPAPFGRTKKDTERMAAIERGRAAPVAETWQAVREDINDLHAFLEELPARAWDVEGKHETLGVMSMERIIDEFLVGHLEQHADQLESLARS